MNDKEKEKGSSLFGLGKIKSVFTRRTSTATKKEERDDSSSQSADVVSVSIFSSHPHSFPWQQEEPTPRRPDEEIMGEVKQKYYEEMEAEAVTKGGSSKAFPAK